MRGQVRLAQRSDLGEHLLRRYSGRGQGLHVRSPSPDSPYGSERPLGPQAHVQPMRLIRP